MNNWRKNWVVFSSAHGDTGDKIWTLLRNEDCEVKEWFIDSSIRGILTAMGLDTTQSHVFRGSAYVGTLKDVEPVIYILKRQAGEIDYQMELPIG
jgi:hypothetical protein